MPTRRRTHRHPPRRILDSPLAHYGFTALAVLAFANSLLWPALICGAAAALAWKEHDRR